MRCVVGLRPVAYIELLSLALEQWLWCSCYNDNEDTHLYVKKALQCSHSLHAVAQYLVRGNCGAEYHKDAAEPTLLMLEEAGVGYDVLGGGRIQVVCVLFCVCA
jgi:hypothetical protein